MKTFTVGDYVTWKMLDGNTMAGEVLFDGYSSVLVKRVDGTECIVPHDSLSIANNEDIEEACAFFANIGK